MKCYYVDHHRYINNTKLGYLIKPCCRARTNGEVVEHIEDIDDSKLLNEIKSSFKNDVKHVACYECWNNEDIGVLSKRQAADYKYNFVENNIEDWDIRPDNTCNLKCIMCNPHDSSKWSEDKEIYFKTFGDDYNKIDTNLDWDYITKNTIDKAKRIYIAGGEPFYMKNVLTFLTELSQHSWNRKNTFIDIQTNGVSFNRRLLDVLDKFELQHIGFSIDGWKQVNEIIRFPTEWNTLYKNLLHFKKLYKTKQKSISINVTVSALNLPNIDTLLENTKDIKVNLNELYNPRLLHINSLHTSVIEKIKTENIFLKNMIDRYKFNEENNIKIKKYLQNLDIKRRTDSKLILPWCWE